MNTNQGLKLYPLKSESPFDEAVADDSSWVLSLSDLMSLLLIFFLVWTTIKIVQLKKEVNVRQPATPHMHLKNMSKIKGMLFEFSPVEVKRGGIMIVLDQEVTFSQGSDRLSSDGKKIISRIARVLKGSTHYRLKVLGHTDSVPVDKSGRFRSNVELSLARATAVANELIAQGMDPERIWIQGLGDMYPRKLNGKTQKGFNRRVELLLEPSA